MTRKTSSGRFRWRMRLDGESIEAAREILLNAEPEFPKEAIIKYNLACYYCQLAEIKSAKEYLNKAFEVDSTWRLQALDDEDLRLLWDSV